MNEKKYILYAEDNPNDIELALEALDEINLKDRIQVVTDGAEALNYLFKRGKYKDRTGSNPIIILLDIKMPKVDGLQVLRAIKNSPELKNIPVVILTSSKEENDLKQCYELNTNAYVVKPMDFVQFTTAMKEIGMFWVNINEPPPILKN